MDIKARLRRAPYQYTSIRHEAAQEIERLESRLAVAVEALEEVANHPHLELMGSVALSMVSISANAIAKIKETK